MSAYYQKGETLKFQKFKKISGLFLIILGVSIFIYFFFPVFSYEIFLSGAFENSNIEVPIPKYLLVNRESGVGSLIAQGINSLTRNYNDARNWYPQITEQAKEITHGTAKVNVYQISIPKLKIENADVSTVDYDLDRHLVQYLGTSIPGERGTAVIFGHSTIPAWFDPKNYKAIFATLHTIKIGDEVTTTVNDAVYRYKIFSIVITTPEDINILGQSYDNSYLTIVTCTPPGTTWKRLVVRAALQQVKQNSI